MARRRKRLQEKNELKKKFISHKSESDAAKDMKEKLK